MQEDPTPKYSTNIADAWKVVEKMEALGYQLRLARYLEGPAEPAWYAAFIGNGLHAHQTANYAETAPLAICRAALLAKAK